MQAYRIRYIHGWQGELRQVDHGWVLADSIQQALAAKSAWPVELIADGCSAWAKHPGTSLYYLEAWEAEAKRS